MSLTPNGDARREFFIRAAAQAAWRLAREHCRPDCITYHRVRPLLRWLGLSAEPADQMEFFQGALSDAFAAGAAGILVCGTSDTAMPDIVISAAEGFGGSITVIDRCETPLRLVAAYAATSRPSLRTEAADVLDWRPPVDFDLIVTHSFLGQFAPAARPGLMRKWFGLLKPGGRIVTVNRLRPTGGGTSFGPSDGLGLADEAGRRYEAAGPFPGVSPDEISAAVQAYTRSRHTHPVRSIEEMRELFETAAFEIICLEPVRSPPRSGAFSGPALPDGAVYAHVVARRPVG